VALRDALAACGLARLLSRKRPKSFHFSPLHACNLLFIAVKHVSIFHWRGQSATRQNTSVALRFQLAETWPWTVWGLHSQTAERLRGRPVWKGTVSSQSPKFRERAGADIMEFVNSWYFIGGMAFLLVALVAFLVYRLMFAKQEE
jgi:hypothetical protein